MWPVDDLELFLRDAELRGAEPSDANRNIVASALAERKLSRCGLCRAPSSSIAMFTKRASPGRLRATFYGLCSACKRRPDFDARASARISAGDRAFSCAVELASHGPEVLERAEFLDQFTEPMREFLRERVTYPQRFGLDWCGWCLSRPMAAFGILNPQIRESDGMYSLFVYSLCAECILNGRHEQMQAKIQSRIAARDSIRAVGTVTHTRRRKLLRRGPRKGGKRAWRR